MTTRLHLLIVSGLTVLLGPGAARPVLAQEPTVRELSTRSQPAPRTSSGSPVSDYFASRFSDLGDMMNLRLRGGPGLSAHARFTRHIDLFGGSHNLWNLGIPGYDSSSGWGPWWEPETEHGLMFFGVDATDDTPYEVGYSDAELNLGLQLLLVGAELGVDPVEIGDFLVGIFGMDPAGDDVGSPPRTVPQPVSAKPSDFDGLGHRLRYVRRNFNQDLDRHVNRADQMFVRDQVDRAGGAIG